MVSSRDFSPHCHAPYPQCRQEGRSILCVTRGNSPPSFQVHKRILYKMSELVQYVIILPLYLAVFPRWDNHLHPCSLSLLHNRIRIIAAVCQQNLGIDPLYEFFSQHTIRCGTLCNKYSDRHTMRIHGQMYLGIEPPFVTAIS